MSHDLDEMFVASLERSVAKLGIGAAPLGDGPGVRRGAGGARRHQVVMTVVEQDGVLHLEAEPPPPRLLGGRRRSARSLGVGGTVVRQARMPALGQNQVGAALAALDTRLTPSRGLRELREDGTLGPATARPEGRLLLLVHGTFSTNDHLVGTLSDTAHGHAFLEWARSAYDQVLGFDHPTLSVSPILNAHALRQALRASRASIDVIAHSRGGLVARWWAEAFDPSPPTPRRVVFVASPLNGTGLAAPPNLRGSLSLLANYGRALGLAAAMLPFTTVVAGLFQVFASITSLASRTPVIDAAFSMVPGLLAMSRVSNNYELQTQRERAPEVRDRYFAVRANFESQRPGWRFWEVFRGLGDRAADAVADRVFDGPNDLVVDTVSMANFREGLVLPPHQILDFGTTDRVHHTNYLEQKETLAFIRRKLSAPAAGRPRRQAAQAGPSAGGRGYA